jgi:predicted Ser/Thr protein kinase
LCIREKIAVVSRILSLPEVTALGCCTVALISRGSPTKPDLFRLDFDDGRDPIVLKTYALKNVFVRATAGWFVTRREYKLLRHLEGIQGIGRLAQPQSRLGLFLKWIPGRPLYRFGKDALSQEVFNKLVAIVKKMHHAGVVHLDIGHKGNVLVTPEERPVLIDFQSALYVRNWPGWLKKWLRRVDDLTLLKWKERRFPQMLTLEEQQACRQREKMLFLWPWSNKRARTKRKELID